ncbi:MAG: TIGR00725 family protein [Planctomycetota bacterium]|jgi:uncharacterized protein (TIGR00725 family)|nr:TIGR00725 family protein [Planctomycetota bacterium]
MSAAACFYHDGENLLDVRGNVFDSASIAFKAPPRAVEPSWSKLSGREAVAWLQKRPGRIRPPIAVVGPREADSLERERAYRLGRELAGVGLVVLCGGRQGVMEEVCRGVAEENGISVGLLPEGDWKSANPHVGIPIASGIGIARNALIARAAHVMLAVGAGLGTISEMALGLQFGKRVFALSDRPILPGVEAFPEWELMQPHFYAAVLNWRG